MPPPLSAAVVDPNAATAATALVSNANLQVATAAATVSSSPNPKPADKPQLSDFFTTEDNHLDFSRFQAFIWTIFAGVVYLVSYNLYLNTLTSIPQTVYNQISDGTVEIDPTMHMQPQIDRFKWESAKVLFLSKEEIQSIDTANAGYNKRKAGAQPLVGGVQPARRHYRREDYPTDEQLPSLPVSFIVLMGLSQGAYVGKKLIIQ